MDSRYVSFIRKFRHLNLITLIFGQNHLDIKANENSWNKWKINCGINEKKVIGSDFKIIIQIG